MSDNTLDFKSAPGRVYAPLAAIVGYAPHVFYVYFSHTFPADWRSFLLLLCCPPPRHPHPRRRRRFLLLTLLLAAAALPAWPPSVDVDVDVDAAVWFLLLLSTMV